MHGPCRETKCNGVLGTHRNAAVGHMQCGVLERDGVLGTWHTRTHRNAGDEGDMRHWEDGGGAKPPPKNKGQVC